MKSRTERVDSSLKLTKMCSAPMARAQPRLECRERGHGQRALGLEQRPAVETGPFEQHELEQEERAHLADVVDGLGEPAARARPGRRTVAWKSVRFGPRVPGSLPTGLDQPAALEQLERPVDERPSDRPDTADARPAATSPSRAPSRARGGRRAARGQTIPPAPGRVRPSRLHRLLGWRFKFGVSRESESVLTW